MQIAYRLVANHNVRTKLVSTIIAGDEHTDLANERIRIAAGATTAQLQQRVMGVWQDVAGAQVTHAQAIQFETFMAQSYPAHRNVLTNNVYWRTFYNVAMRTLNYVDAGGAAVVRAAVETVPCYDCELVCRLDANITIDHQRPQGGNELEPICKVWRAMGLTIDGPDGLKGQDIILHWGPLVGGLASANVGTRAAKYTLNNAGKIYYTLSEWNNEYGTLVSQSLNHIVNLRPLCHACNTPNRNVAYF